MLPSGGADPAPGAGEAAASSDAHDHAADSCREADPASLKVDPPCDEKLPGAGALGGSASQTEDNSGEAHGDGWHEVSPGGIYDTVENHVAVANGLAKIPEVN